jgi:hypothetical protein
MLLGAADLMKLLLVEIVLQKKATAATEMFFPLKSAAAVKQLTKVTMAVQLFLPPKLAAVKE